MNGRDLTLGLVGALAVGAMLGRRAGSRARSTLPAGLRAYPFSEDESQPGDEARETKARALAKKVNIGILRDKNLRLVVQKGPKVVGALFDSLDGGHYSFDFIVDPAVQGTGIGSWLMDEADRLAREYEDMGFPSVVEAVNPIAQAMLVRRGFTVTDRGAGYAILERGEVVDEEVSFNRSPAPTDAALRALRAGMTKAARADTAFAPAKWKRAKDPLTGHCHAVAHVVRERFGGELVKGTVKGQSHAWNRLPGGREVDLSGSQYGGDGLHPLVTGEVAPWPKSVNPRFARFAERVDRQLARR